MLTLVLGSCGKWLIMPNTDTDTLEHDIKLLIMTIQNCYNVSETTYEQQFYVLVIFGQFLISFKQFQ